MIASRYAIRALNQHLDWVEISREHRIHPLRRTGIANSSLVRLNALGRVHSRKTLSARHARADVANWC